MTALVVVLLAVAPLAAVAGPAMASPVSDGSSAPEAASGASQESDQVSELRLVQELRLTPERPGEIEVRLRYEVPDRLTALVAGLPSGATVVSTNGFQARGNLEYDWDGRSATPSITYRLPANETGDVRGPEGAEGQYLFVDVGEWALVERPRVATNWRWTGSGRVELNRTATVDGPGAAGEATAFLGEHRELRSTAHGQTFRLVVPDAAALAESPDAVFAALANASGALRVGDRDETVFAVAAPSGTVGWGARGLQVGDADMWVLDDERLDDPGDTWTHEYVHTRQSFETTPTAAWVTEAMATYYAALLALEDGRVGFEAFERWLSLGTRSPYGDAVLADPTTWRGARPDYLKGGLVMGELDRRIRLESEHEHTAQTVFRRTNERDRPVNGTAFVELVAAVGGDELREAATTYSTTSAVPAMWSRAAHDRAFGPSPALIDAVLVESRIAGPYRNATAGPPVVVAVGETLSLDVRVENVGGTAGPYDVAFRVDGAVEARRAGRLAPNESTTVSFERAFDEPGTYAVAAADDRLTVEVVEPATARVVDVRASSTSLRPGETVTVSTTVRNDASIPGEREVVLTRNGEPVGSRTVRLGPGESRTVSLSTTLAGPGDYRLEVDDESVDVRVEEATEDRGGPRTNATAPPGDGVAASPGTLLYVAVAALLAVALLVGFWRLRGRP